MNTMMPPPRGRATLWLLRLLSAAMLLLSAGLLLWNLLWPQSFETAARGFVQQRIVSKLGQRLHDSRAYALKEKAKGLLDRLGVDADEIETDLAKRGPQWVASAMDALCGYDCERRKLELGGRASDKLKVLANLKLGRSTVGDIVRGYYLQLVGDLRLRLRTALAVAVALSLLLLISSARRSAPDRNLLLAASLLLASMLALAVVWLQARGSLYRALFDGGWDWAFAALASAVAVLLLMSLGRDPGRVVPA